MCDGAPLARELIAVGNEVRLMPLQYVKAYVKRNKNDLADAEAICERSNARRCASCQ
jgi:transposase